MNLQHMIRLIRFDVASTRLLKSITIEMLQERPDVGSKREKDWIRAAARETLGKSYHSRTLTLSVVEIHHS